MSEETLGEYFVTRLGISADQKAIDLVNEHVDRGVAIEDETDVEELTKMPSRSLK
jgi:hypothetical protein